MNAKTSKCFMVHIADLIYFTKYLNIPIYLHQIKFKLQIIKIKSYELNGVYTNGGSKPF